MRTETSKKPGVLMIGVLPPPTGGMATSLANLLTSSLKDEYELSVLDVVGYRTRKEGNVFQGLWHQAFLMFKLAGLLVQKDPKIVHIHMAAGLYFLRRGLDIILCKLFGKKVIVHMRASSIQDDYAKGPAARLEMRLSLAMADRVIALSDFWKVFLSKLTDQNKIVVIPNGVNVSEYGPVNSREAGLRCDGNCVEVLFMGQIATRKGAFDLVKAIPRVVEKTPNVHFVFCGPEWLEGDLKKFQDLVSLNNAGPYVRYVGEVAGQGKVGYYLSADMLILPSYNENFPNAVLEGMAAGLPVIASGVGAVPEIMRDGENGFIIKAGDVDAIAGKIVILARDAALRRTMGAKNLGLVKEKYDMPIITKRIGELYRELLS